MVQCFHPECKHQSESHCCRFFTFPDPVKKSKEFAKWKDLIRRADKEPNKHSRVCSCHFRNGDKRNGPEICERNKNKLFDLLPGADAKSPKPQPKKKAKTETDKLPTVQSIMAGIKSSGQKETAENTPKCGSREILLEAEIDRMSREVEEHKERGNYLRYHYSVDTLTPEVLRMETGLPTLEVFEIVVNYVSRFKEDIKYYAGWKVESIQLKDQVFITLMKVRQNYTNLHLAQLFSCSVATISNIVLTFVHVLHSLLFEDIMATIPSRDKNNLCSPSSFSQYSSCRIIIDCTDFEIAAPRLMSQQSATYSTYRGMNSFKVLIGVAPNGVITYVSQLFPGSVSDKEIVKGSSILNHLIAGDLILADKGFLIQKIVPKGVSVNIPPFLNHGRLTESEARATKSIAKCRIHVERANARLKDFKILSFIPSFLRCQADKLCQLCAAIVNLQFPLIKEGCQDFQFE